MNANYWQKGETLDYTPAEPVKTGAVVSLGTRIGIAASDIPANGVGQIHVTGVFEMTKDNTVTVTMGAAVYYNVASDKITTTASGNIPAGYAAAAAAQADTAVLVKLMG